MIGRMLGLGSIPGHRIDALTFDGRCFEARIGAEGDGAVLRLTARKPKEKAFLQSEHLTLVHVGNSLPRPLVEGLMAHAFAEHADATLQSLVDALDADPEAWSSQSDGRPRADQRRREPHIVDPTSYADFLGVHDVPDLRVIQMWLFNPASILLHGDSECFGPPNLGIDMVMTLNTPWDNRVRDRSAPSPSAARAVEPAVDELGLYVTDVRDQDVIRGSRRRERGMFEHVFDRDPGPVVLFEGCVGVVAGSGVLEVYEEYKAKHHLPVLQFRGGENQCLQGFYTEILVDERRVTEHPPDAPDHLINLVGYSGCATREMLDALDTLGIEINTNILPALTVPAAQRFERAGLNVVLPNAEYETFYEQLQRGTGIERQLMAPSPYGFDGTEAWLRTVAAETGREDGLEDLLEGLRAPRRARWDDLVGRARGVSLALVARDNEAGQLLDRAFTWGIPLLTTLPEMGFDLDVLLLSTDEEATRSARERFADAGLGEAVELRFFDSFDDMLRMLEQSPSRAVFSSFFYDWRATSTGKAIFSLQHFEPGFEGAVRTLERLLEVCGTSFYARYGRYLRRDRCGRPVGRRR